MAASDSSPRGKYPGVDDLRQGGILSQRLPGYQERPAQIEMAMVVAEALATSRHALIEAPTGVGKSQAYLLPLVRSGKVAIISTANKALQEQLYYKDIPFVQEHVQRFDASLYKGVNNYLCLDRLATALTEGLPDAQYQELQQIRAVIEQLAVPYTGDFDQLPRQVSPELRGRINGDSDLCAWSKCRYYRECYIRQRYEQAQRAQIIVVNHTLLLLDMATGGAILPSHEVIIIDEAHHLEEEATRACAMTVRYTQITSLLTDKLLRAHAPPKLQDEVMRRVTSTWQQLEQQMPATGANTMTLRHSVPQALRLAKSLSTLSAELGEHPPSQQDAQEEVIYQKLVQRTQRLADRVRLVFSVEQPDFVYVLKREVTPGRHLPSLEGSATPLDVAPWLRERLFDTWPIVIGVSATLATVSPTRGRSADTAPSLAYYKKRVGLEKHEVLERILPLLYDYQHRTLLYVPRDLPEPAYDEHQATPEYMQAVAERMRQLVMVSGGRAFLLFTSQSMLRHVYQTLAPDLPYPLLCQGDLPRAELIHRFKNTGNAVLFGLRSFWEGVDIPGEALSLVVIDRLPFHPPDDPVHEARIACMKARRAKNKDEEDWFTGYVVPQAVLLLKQGVGRLLRSDDDRGVIAILDPRLHTKGYGKIILHALPPALLVTRLEEVERFYVHHLPPGKTSS